MGMLDSLTNYLYPSPANAGMPYLDQISGTMQKYEQPYINNGLNNYGQLQNSYSNLINNPTGMVNQIGQGYHQSPGYQFQLNQGEQGINNAAAAGGMLGSNQHQQQAGQLANNMANQDFYNYLNTNLGQYNNSMKMGMGGLQSFYDTGAGAGNDLANSLAQALMAQSNMAYQGQAQQNANKGSLIGGLAGLVGL